MASISNLQFQQQHRKKGKGKKKTVRGFDTENRPTRPASVLCSDLAGRYIDNLDDALKFLTHKEFNSTLNVFFNLDYDVRSILKHNPAVLTELYFNQEAEYEQYTLTYIPDKVFKIKKKSGKSIKTWSYYDSFQYFNTSLEDAVKQYLNKKVSELKAKRSELFDKYNIDTIIDYCISDCQNTKEITEFLLKGYEGLNFYPDNLMSVGAISKSFCQEKSNIPKLNYLHTEFSTLESTLNVIDAYYQAYRGGWFEIQKRGYFNEVWGYDIVSAYPAITRDLPDIRSGRFYYIESEDDLEDTDVWGTIRVKIIQKDLSVNVCPLSININERLFYPYIDTEVEKWITLREYRAFSNVYDFTIIEGWIFRPFFEDVDRPFKNIIDMLFDVKQSYKKGTAIYQAGKLTMNSVYGNMIQTTTKSNGITYTGSFFNSFYAAEITAYCRVKIWDLIKDNLDNVIMIATDGVLLDQYIPVQEDSNLGGWEIEVEGEKGIFVESGVYQIRGKKSKGRGVGRVDFFNKLRASTQKIQFHNTRPIKSKEAIIQDRIEDINKFEEQEKEKFIWGDVRRIWDNQPVIFRELTKKNFKSKPVSLAFMKEIINNDKIEDSVEPHKYGNWLEEFELLT